MELHLEATPNLATLRSLATETGLALPDEIEPDSEKSHEYESLAHFIRVLSSVNSLDSTPQIYGRLLYEALQTLARQNVVYAEIRFSPARPVLDRGINFGELLEQLGRAKERGEADFGIESGLILSLSRNRGSDVCTRLAVESVELSDGTLAGFDISDDESKWPAHLFRSTFEVIDRAGYPTTIHAGETVGPESITDAINLPGAKRIGHGLSAYRDPELMKRLLRDDIHLELCPTSNVGTNQIAAVEEHPILTYLEAGLSVSVNSDDPIAFGNDISTEYALLAGEFGLRTEAIEDITINAAEAAFAPDDVRARICGSIAEGYKAIRSGELEMEAK